MNGWLNCCNRSGMSPTCSMQGMSTANMGWVYCLPIQSYCSHGSGVDNTCGGQDYQDDTASHGGSIHQGGLMCNHNPHIQIFWNVSDGRHTVGGHHESSSYETPKNISVWRLSHIAHTCRDGYLQQGEIKMPHHTFRLVLLALHECVKPRLPKYKA